MPARWLIPVPPTMWSPRPPAREWDTHTMCLALILETGPPLLVPMPVLYQGGTWLSCDQRSTGSETLKAHSASASPPQLLAGLGSARRHRVLGTARLPLEGRRPPTWHFLGGGVSLSRHAGPRGRRLSHLDLDYAM